MSRKLIFLFVFTLFFTYSRLSLAQSVTAENLFWDSPQTVHGFKKPLDLHNVVGSAAALTEIEFVRIGDGLVDFSLRRSLHPFGHSFDQVHQTYHAMPFLSEHSVGLRFEQLFDALQIRQFSLSDARTFLFPGDLSTNGRGAVFNPIMQTRLFKILILLEDVISDLDRLVMLPINESASLVKREPIRIKSIGYTAPILGWIRQDLFKGIRKLDKTVVKIGSNLIYRIEDIHNSSIRRKKQRRNQHFLLYLRMPVRIYNAHRKFFEQKVKLSYTDSALELTVPENSEGFMLIAIEANNWRSAPQILQNYVITQEEFEAFVSKIPTSSSLHI